MKAVTIATRLVCDNGKPHLFNVFCVVIVPGRSGRKSSWLSVSSPNSLEDVYKLYYGRGLDKTPRNVFINGDLADVREHFQVCSHVFIDNY